MKGGVDEPVGMWCAQIGMSAAGVWSPRQILREGCWTRDPGCGAQDDNSLSTKPPAFGTWVSAEPPGCPGGVRESGHPYSQQLESRGWREYPPAAEGCQ